VKNPPATNIKRLTGYAAGVIGCQVKRHGCNFIGIQNTLLQDR
jgi:hypothetical protein